MDAAVMSIQEPLIEIYQFQQISKITFLAGIKYHFSFESLKLKKGIDERKKLKKEYGDLLEKVAEKLYQDKVLDDWFWEEEILLSGSI